jgi:hypothetical protein
MKAYALAGVVAVVLVAGGRAEDPKPVAPQKEHEWLRQLEGEGVTEMEATPAPGQKPEKGKGTESAKSLGGLWLVSELKTECMGVTMTGLMTVGYDTSKKQYVGTWVCSAGDQMFEYVGSVSGQTLTLGTEGPSPTDPKKTVKMKDVIELKDKDTKVLTSLMQGEDGKWVTFMTLTAKRKK